MIKRTKVFLLLTITLLVTETGCEHMVDSIQTSSSSAIVASFPSSSASISLETNKPTATDSIDAQTSISMSEKLPVETTTVPAVDTTSAPSIEELSSTPTTELTPVVKDPVVPSDDEMVELSEYLPEAVLDIRYASQDNFTEQVIYTHTDAYLRYGTVKKLRLASEMLADQGYILLIWDAWRPAEAQWKLWEICPDGNYVSDPNKGYSSHTRGGTVDVSLLNSDGKPVPMPTDFDDFTVAADRDYSDIPDEPAENARLLESVMIACGFNPYQKEWWHFTDMTSWDVLESLPNANIS